MPVLVTPGGAAGGAPGGHAPGIRAKICGVRDADAIEAALRAGAAYVGLVFFARSPRAVTIPQARALALAAPPGLAKVALVVDMDDGRARRHPGRRPDRHDPAPRRRDP